MRMSIPRGIAACAIVAVPLMSVALLSTPAFAAKQSAVLQQGPDALVMLVGAKGNVSPQRAGTVVVAKPIPAVKPYRPTVDNPQFYCGGGNPHCGPNFGGGNKPEVRDHRSGSSGPYNPQSKSGGGNCPGYAYGPNGWYQS